MDKLKNCRMDTRINRAMLEFKKKYTTAYSAVSADERFTTSQIHEMLTDLTGDESLKVSDIPDLMESHGFKFEFFLNEFVWPVKAKSK